MKTQEILRAAAGRVRQGWCRGHQIRGNDRCAMGAINEVMTGKAIGFELYDAAPARAIVEALGLERPIGMPLRYAPGSAVARWNNGAGQTADNVAAGLEYAALYIEEKEKEERETAARSVERSPAGALAD